MKQHLAETIRAARLRKGLTQEALAEQVGVTVETISNSERAESLVTLPVFLRLVATLELSLTEVTRVPATATRRKVTARRRRLEGDLEHLSEQMSDADLDLLIGIGRLIQASRRS